MDGRGGAALDALIAASTDETPDAPALLAVDGTMVSFAELSELVGRWRTFLRAAGVGRTDAVAVVLPNGVEMATTFLGVASAAVCAPLNPAFTESEVNFSLDDLQARILVSDGSSAAAEAAALAAGIPILRPGEASATAQATSDDDHAAPSDVALVLHTSGTTARPKQVPLTHANLFASAENVAATLGLAPTDRCVNVMPLFHIHGLVAALLASMHARASVVCAPGFDPTRFLDWSRDSTATWYTAVPTIHQAVLTTLRADPRPNFRFIRSSSAALPPSVLHALEAAFDCPVVEAYGMTEAAHQMASNPLPPAPRKSGTVGRAAGPEVAVMAPDGQLLGAGVIGEIVIRGPNVTSGYTGLAVANEAAFAHGWFHTGDEGTLDDDGYLTITGRIKELINRGGEKISPREVDEVLLDHAAISQAVTFAVPHPNLGEDVAAAVVVAARTSVTTGELQEFAGTRLAPHKVPQRIVVLDELPKGPTGKLQRIGLAERLGLGGAADRDRPTAPSVHAPGSATEAALHAVWSHALGVDRVGPDEEFLNLGGDSLSAVLLVADVAEVFGVELPASAPFEDAATIATMAELIATTRRPSPSSSVETAAHSVEPDGAALTHAQEGSWFLDALTGRQVANNAVLALRLRGPVDPAIVGDVLGELVARHDALRARYPGGPDGRPTVIVEPTGTLPLETTDATNEEDAREQVEQLVGRRLDPLTGPIAAARLVRIAADDQVLALVAHHMTMDDWARGRLRNELAASYTARADGRPSPLTDRPLGAPAFGARRRRALADGSLDEHLAYWRAALEPPPEPLELFPARPRSTAPDLSGGTLERSLPAAVRNGLVEVARQHHATLFMALLTGYVALLHRHTGRTDLAVAVPTAGRRGAEAEAVVGQMANALPVRVDASGAPAFSELLGRVRTACLGAYAHQEVPFERIVEELRIERRPERRPLVQVAFQLRNLPPVVDAMGTVEIEDFGIHPRVSIDDLAVEVTDQADGLDFRFEYSAGRFDAETASAFAGELLTLLTAAAVRPDAPIAELALVADADRDHLLQLGVGSPLPASTGSVYERIAARAAADPDAAAVVAGDVTLTYEQVVADADRFAARLAAAGAGPGTTVAVSLERGPRLPGAYLGVFRTGAALLPLDTEHPVARTRTLLESAGASIVVADLSLDRDVVGRRAIVTFDGDAPDPPPEIAVQRRDPAYVMFTSGTSGTPKGVTIEHGALADAFTALHEHVGLEPGDTVLASTALSFDPSLRELLFPLTVGARVAITDAPLGLDPGAAARTAERAAATVVQGTPTALQMLLDAGWSPNGPATVWSCGDRLPTEVAAHLLNRVGADGAVWNLYGVTENTQCAFAHRVHEPASPIPVGRPLPGVVAEVVDETLAPVPLAMEGEILLGGTGLARGYLDTGGDTPFVELPRGRRYRTGDIARWQPNGELVFVGRRDAQVKLRGVRIELGELEAVLRAHPAVTDAVADVRDGRLVAWAVLQPGVAVDPGELRAHAAASLPVMLVPGVVAAVDAVPRTPSGKVERARLATPAAMAAEPANAGDSVPASETERMMASVWGGLLSPGRQLRLDDDFFALGGHSLLVVELAVEIDLRFGHELPITQLFDTPTLGGLATAIDALGPPRSTTPADPETAAVPLRAGRDDAPPLFLVPGIGGTVLALHRIAPMIDYPHPVVGFEAPGHRYGPIDQSVEDLAGDYLVALHEVQPDGPVVLGGFSFGGYVAFEMACRLTAAGRDVRLVLLDTGVPGGLPGGEKRTRRRRAVRRIERLRDRMLRRPDARVTRPPHLAARVRPNLAAVGNASRKAAARYRPVRGRALSSLTVVVSSKRSAETLAEGWQRVADAPTEAHVVGGRHGALLWDRDTAPAVAAILNGLLADALADVQTAGGGPQGGRGADGRTGTGAPSASATSSQ